MKQFIFRGRLRSPELSLVFPLFILAGLLISLGGTAPSTLLAAPTAIFDVNASFDAVDANPGDGICAISPNLGGACTLRAAIQEANLQSGSTVINLPPFVYLLTISGNDNPPSAAQAQVGDLDISNPAGVTINGAGAIIIENMNTTIFDQHPIFHIHAGATAVIDGLTITQSAIGYRNDGDLTVSNGAIHNGRVRSSGTGFLNPGISSSGSLTLTNFIVQNMPSSGAISSVVDVTAQDKTINLTNVHFKGNGSSGLNIRGSQNVVEIVDSSFDSLFTGVQLNSNNHQITISNSTISNNSLQGIAISYVNNTQPLELALSNVTVSGNQNGINTFTGSTGGVGRANIHLNNVTITNNHGNSSFGGGIRIIDMGDVGPHVFVKNSIIAGNGNFDCQGTMQSAGHNLIGDSDGCVIQGVTTGNILDQSPNLANLADNGGPTQTHALLAGSPALDAGNPAVPGSGGNACEATDQIGANRPLGVACDIGAVEGAEGTAVPPVLTTLSPNSIAALGPDFTLTVNGSGFNNSATVRWKGQNRPTTFISDSELQAAIPAADLLSGEVVDVTIFDPVQGVSSNALPFTINNPLPVVNSLTPTTVRSGAGTFVTIGGSNFTGDAQILMDGTPLETVFVSSSQVRAFVPGSATTPVGRQITLRVQNPAPGGGTSANFVTLTAVAIFPPRVGEGAFSSDLQAGDALSLLTLNWVHPSNWRDLDSMEVRLLDEDGRVALWLGFVEELGQQGAIVMRDAEGRIAGMGFPGETIKLGSQLGLLELEESLINGVPGTTIEVVYAFRFNPDLQGKTFHVEISANNNEDNNADGHGFESVGTLTIPTQLFLPVIVAP